MYKEMKKRNMTINLWFTYVGIMLAYLLFINLKTPMIGEDYAFLFHNTNKIDLAKEVFKEVIYKFYPDNNTFNLRVGDTLAILWLNLGEVFGVGKILFSILNAIVTLLFFVLIFYWGNCRLPNTESIKDLATFSVIPVLFLICSFSIGEIFFWCGGATNYLWAGVILLSTAIPYRKYLHDEKYKMENKSLIGYIIASYIAAFTNENTVPIIILLGGFLLLRGFIKNGIKKIPVWLLLSVLSMGIGYSILLFSPNTKRRTIIYRNMFNLPENMSLSEIKNNVRRVIGSFIVSNYRFIILFFICLSLLFIILIYQHKRSQQKYSISIFSSLYENVFILSLSSISVIALFFAPYTEIRSFLFVQIFIIMFITYINNVILSVLPDNYKKYLPNICLCILSLMFISRLTFWTLDYSKFDRNRTESIKKQINDGKSSIIVKRYFIEKNKYLNTREVWTSEPAYGGSYFYQNYHGANNIIWKTDSYEEDTIELDNNSHISILQNVSEIQTYDISSYNFDNENLFLYCDNNDPQVYFPLQKPIKNISDAYYVDISYKNSVAGVLQVYYDFGNGLNEGNSVRLDINKNQEMIKIKVPIVGWEKGDILYMFRIDPPNGTEFEIESILLGKN